MPGNHLFNEHGHEYRGQRTFEHVQRSLPITYRVMDLQASGATFAGAACCASNLARAAMMPA
jgi:hypothetical protein